MMGPMGAGLFVAAFGAVFAGAGGGSLAKERGLRRHGAQAAGTVVRVEARGGKDGTSYHPVVQYRTADGQLVEQSSSFGGSRRSRYRPGQPVAVLYDPAKPRRMSIVGHAVGGRIVFLLVGVAALAYGLWMFGSAALS